ncbi:MAG: RNA polymerase sigma-54 factor, partial [Oleiphilaceae bacterium]
MKVSLQLKLGQQLTMTPQLQQAIRLLQLSTLDLQQEIQEALESNPMLELHDEDSGNSETSDYDSKPSEQNDQTSNNQDLDNFKNASDSPSSDKTSSTETASDEWSENIPDDLPVDTVWEDIYPNNSPSSSSASEDDLGSFESRNSQAESLNDHLQWQLNLTPMSDRDRYIAISIIDSTNTDGYLSVSIEEILEDLYSEDDEDPVEMDEVQAVLKRIQHFDPPGVFAKDLPDCLLLQLKQLDKDTPWLGQAKLVISHYLNLLANRDYAQLIRRSRLKENELKEVIDLIQSLNPRPGESIATSEPEYIVPDVIVKKEK